MVKTGSGQRLEKRPAASRIDLDVKVIILQNLRGFDWLWDQANIALFRAEAHALEMEWLGRGSVSISYARVFGLATTLYTIERMDGCPSMFKKLGFAFGEALGKPSFSCGVENWLVIEENYSEFWECMGVIR